MDTMTVELFQRELSADENGSENALFEALRAIRHMAFEEKDFFDGAIDGLSGWNVWW